MSTSHDRIEVGEGERSRSCPTGSHGTPSTPAPDRRALEDQHTRILAQAVGDHLPYELALRAAAVAEQLRNA